MDISTEYVTSVFVLILSLIRPLNSAICVSTVCEYTLEIRWGRTMTYRPEGKVNAYNVDTDNDRLRIVNSSYFQDWDDAMGRYVDDITPDVITADGVKRNVITINEQFPGPTIEVAEGSQVVVHVVNELFTEEVTVHWHGISQLFTPWMDGTAHVSQCPIGAKSSFTYRFMAYPVGTHWYHSLIENQRLDGLYGAFIVHRIIPEIPDHPLIITDWFHEGAAAIEVQNPRSVEDKYKGDGDGYSWVNNRHYSVDGHELSKVMYQSALINGRGRFSDKKLPLTTFEVEGGTKHRFRLISAAAEYSFEVSIDSHVLSVRAVDGAEIQPLEVTAVVLHPGETVDVEFEADQAWKLYWIRARIPNFGSAKNATLGARPFPTNGEVKEVRGILRYKGSFLTGDPSTEPYTCSDVKKCRIFNCAFSAFPEVTFKECIAIANAQSLAEDKDRIIKEYGLRDPEFDEYFLNFGYNWGASINGNRFVSPSQPFSQQSEIPSHLSCSKEACQNQNVGCFCMNIQEIPINRTIQLVLTNYEPNMNGGFTYMAPYPVHLHGHDFAVVRMGFATHEAASAMFVEENPDIICPNQMCKTPRWNGLEPANGINLETPPIKNTVIIPARGYVVIRFRTGNPGYWPLSSQVSSARLEGMSMLFHEAGGRLTLPPLDFPTCHRFTWTASYFHTYRDQTEHLAKTGNTDFTTRLTTLPTSAPPPTTTTPKPIEMCQPLDENQLIIGVNTMIGFGAGCVAIGAFLVLLALCVYMMCQRTKFRIEGIA